MASDEKTTNSIDLSQALVFLPVVGSALAVTYDVGYFYGLDIGYFTVFSFSEHLVFALQAVPIALAGIVTIVGCVVSGLMGYQQSRRERLAYLQANEDDARRLLSIRKKKMKLFFWIMFAVICIYIGASIYARAWTATALGAIALVPLIGVYVLPHEVLIKPLGLSWMLFSCLLVSFTIGLDRANDVLSATIATHSLRLEGGELTGLLIRSGERGILFFNTSTRKIELLIWNDVKSAITIAPRK